MCILKYCSGPRHNLFECEPLDIPNTYGPKTNIFLISRFDGDFVPLVLIECVLEHCHMKWMIDLCDLYNHAH